MSGPPSGFEGTDCLNAYARTRGSAPPVSTLAAVYVFELGLGLRPAYAVYAQAEVALKLFDRGLKGRVILFIDRAGKVAQVIQPFHLTGQVPRRIEVTHDTLTPNTLAISGLFMP